MSWKYMKITTSPSLSLTATEEWDLGMMGDSRNDPKLTWFCNDKLLGWCRPVIFNGWNQCVCNKSVRLNAKQGHCANLQVSCGSSLVARLAIVDIRWGPHCDVTGMMIDRELSQHGLKSLQVLHIACVRGCVCVRVCVCPKSGMPFTKWQFLYRTWWSTFNQTSVPYIPNQLDG